MNKMEHSIAFDTLAYSKKFLAADFTQQQAEALADLVNEQLVSGQYLDIRLNEIKADIIKWMAGMLMAQAAIQAAIVATLVKLL